jgi:hypothetical protein
MPFARVLMGHPAAAQLLQDPGLPSHGQLARPFPVYPQPEGASGGEWQIDQPNPKLLRSLKIGTTTRQCGLGRGMLPLPVQSEQRENESKILRAREKVLPDVQGYVYF